MSFVMILEAVMLASALSMDALVASFAYGSDKIRIPILSGLIINVICGSILAVSLLLGTVIRQYIPGSLTTGICFGILFMLGLVKLLDSTTKSIIRRHNNFSKEISFSMFNFRFILNLYANPEDADVDESRSISPAEAASLAVALSFDGLAVGFGAALGDINVLAVIICSLITGQLAILLGCYIGNRIAHRITVNLSWLSGAMLIVLAFLKL